MMLRRGLGGGATVFRDSRFRNREEADLLGLDCAVGGGAVRHDDARDGLPSDASKAGLLSLDCQSCLLGELGKARVLVQNGNILNEVLLQLALLQNVLRVRHENDLRVTAAGGSLVVDARPFA
jgi:hypothetical protein